MDDSKLPAFFKVFIPELCSQRMEIPRAFASIMRGRQLVGNPNFLRDLNGNVWPVKVTREGRKLYFEEGWVRFVEENGVDLGDFLVFQFSGEYFFDFKLLGHSACEKETRTFNFTVKSEEVEGVGEDNGGVEVGENDAIAGEGEGAEDDCDDEEEEDDDEEYDEEEEEEETETDEERGHYEEDEGDSRMKNIKVTVPRKETGTSSAGATKLVCKRKNRSKGKAVVRDEPEVEKRPKKTGDRITDADIFDSGAVARPKNPYFIAQPAGKRSELSIPGDVVKDHQLKFPGYMDIHDEEGKNWRAEVVVWKDGRVLLKKGWKAFCKWNNVKEKDKCLCEFVVDSKQRVLLLQVRIFRAGSIGGHEFAS